MNILITGAWHDAMKYVDAFEKLGHHVRYLQNEKDQLPCSEEWAEGVICNGLFLYHPIEQFVNLRYIQLTSAGYDRVPMDYIKDHNITIFNARGVYSIPMAEFAISSVLNLYKRCGLFRDNQLKNKWIKNREIKELCGETVCIVGCGSVGTECAKRFKAFGTRVIGVDQYPFENESFDQIVGINAIKDILPEADIVILTLPLTKESKHLLNSEKLALLKTDAVLINISRGAVIDQNALIDVLKKNSIYAVLDVFEEEPLSESNPLWNLPNVTITPHNSFVGSRNDERLSKVVIENIYTA